ncbi:MAG: TM1802 family CRISPR-associated protein [Candidatus Sigynarchaeota archaeon]
MIWQYLKAIGNCVGSAVSVMKVDLPENVIEYIRTSFPDPPADGKVITVNIPIDEFDKKLNGLQDTFQREFASLVSKYKNIDFKKAKKENDSVLNRLESDLFALVPIDFIKELGQLFKTQIIDYSPEIALKMLRGEKTGFTVFFSITNSVKGKPTEGLAELPLWKIKLQKDSDWNTPAIKTFFKYIPSNDEMNAIDWDQQGLGILKYTMPELLRRAINTTLVSTAFRSKNYPVCFMLNGKWPMEYEEFVDYYASKITSGKKGTCAICGTGDVEIVDMLKKDIGFFTDDQWSTGLKFSADAPATCTACVSDIKNGFNYVKKNLQFYLSSRGKNKNPFQMYIIPYSPHRDILKDILDDIKAIGTQGSRSKNRSSPIADAGKRGRVAAVIDNKKNNEAAIMPSEPGDDDENEGIDYIDALLRPSIIDDSKLKWVTYMIVIFVHPEGNASSFHNVMDVILADGSTLKKLGAKVEEVARRFNTTPAAFKKLPYVITDYYYPRFLSDLLRLEPVDRTTFFKQAYKKNKKGFIQFAKSVLDSRLANFSPQDDARYIGSNMFILEMTNALMEGLALWK